MFGSLHSLLGNLDAFASDWYGLIQTLLLSVVELNECFDSLFVLVHQNVEVNEVDALDDAVLALNDNLLLELVELRKEQLVDLI